LEIFFSYPQKGRACRGGVSFYPDNSRVIHEGKKSVWIIGITGSIGAGKSFLSKSLESLGVPVHSSDKYIHALLRDDKDIQKEIKKRWPKAVVKGKVDRRILGDCVLEAPSNLRILESILYPKLLISQKKFIKRNHKLRKKAVALDIPLLFEFGFERYCDCIILAVTSSFLRTKRVLRRQGMSLKKFKAFEAEQMNDANKGKLADFIVFCGGERESALKKIRTILYHLFQNPMPKWQGKWPSQVKKIPLKKIP